MSNLIVVNDDAITSLDVSGEFDWSTYTLEFKIESYQVITKITDGVPETYVSVNWSTTATNALGESYNVPSGTSPFLTSGSSASTPDEKRNVTSISSFNDLTTAVLLEWVKSEWTLNYQDHPYTDEILTEFYNATAEDFSFSSSVNRINITTLGEQHDANLAVLPDGHIVAVWNDRSGNDGSANGIFAQIYTSELSPVGDEFIVNSDTDLNQSKPQVSSTSSGDFLITWHEGNGYLSAQFFNQNGSKIGEQFNVRPGWSHTAAVVEDSDGGFWVASNIAQDAIYLKKLSVDGVELTSDIKIDSDVFQSDPSITVLNDQRVLVTWSEVSESGSSDIFGQIISGQGTTQGSVFQLNVTGAGDQLHASVAALSDGGFAAAWQSQGQDGDGYGIVLRQFSSDITGSTEVIVNDVTVGDQTTATVLGLDSGGFIVGWTDNIHINGGAVYAQRFNGFSTKLGSNVLLNDDGIVSLNNSKDVDFVELEDGSVVAAWDSWDGTRDIFARTLSFDEGRVGAVIITGTETEGSTLSLSNTIADAEGLGSFTYQWLRDGSTISGATGTSYTLTQDDVGAAITAEKSYTDDFGNDHSVTSTATSTIANVNDDPTGSVTISGIASQGVELKVDTTTLSDEDGIPSLFGVMDLGVDTNIGRYVQYRSPISLGDRGLNGWFDVELNHPNFGWIPFSASPTDTEQYGPLIATNLEKILATYPITYQWLRDGSAISGATSSAYTLTQDDVGSAISLSISYTDRHGTAESVTSAATSSVTMAPDTVSDGVEIYGENTADVLDGGSEADRIYGLGGADKITTGDGADRLYGGYGDDSLYGEGGDDQLFGEEDDDKLYGGDGADRLYGGYGDDSLYGEGGDDQLFGEEDDDKLYGGEGDDELNGGIGADYMVGGAGNDTYYVDNANDVIDDQGLSSDVDTVIVLNAVTYTLGAGVLNASLDADAGEAGLIGNSAANELTGNDDSNTLSGGDGNDVLYSAGGDDIVDGGRGDDLIIGGSGEGDDTYKGGSGIDTIKYTSAKAGITVDLGQGTASSVGVTDSANIGSDTLSQIENVIAGKYSDTIKGSGVDNILYGGAGNDILQGMSGNDTLQGGNNNDKLYGDDFELRYALPEANQVFRLYQATFNRTPDEMGHKRWTSDLFTGESTLADVREGFVGSQEFRNKYANVDDATFVKQMYINVLDRDFDQGEVTQSEIDSWTNQISEAFTRADVVNGFAESKQLINNTLQAANKLAVESNPAAWSDDVYRLYQATLDRDPDIGGFTDWSDQLSEGGSLADVISGFTNSKEFANTYGVLTDPEDFVKLLYNNVLGRDFDLGEVSQSEITGWTEQLTETFTRANIVQGFSQSAEFTNKTAKDVKDWVQSQGVDDQIDGGAGTNTLSGGSLADQFVFQQTDASTNTVLDLETWDFLSFDGFGYSAESEALKNMSQSGSSVVFSDQGTQVTFERFQLQDITDDMIIV